MKVTKEMPIDLSVSEKRKHISLFLLLLSLSLFNPAVIFLLTKDIVLSMAAPLFSFALSVLTYAHFGLRLVTVYLINFLALISIFLHAEVIFTINFRNLIIDDIYTMRHGYYFNKPNLTKHFADAEYSADYITNTQGYRIPRGRDPKEKIDSADWLIIGDSFTQGAQVDYECLYSTLIYRQFPNKIVVNAGISDAGVVEEMNYFRDIGRLMKPSLVILQIGSFNDFMNIEPPRRTALDYLSHYSNFARFLLADLIYPNPSRLPLGRWVEPFQPDRQSNRDFNIFFIDESSVQKHNLELFRRNLSLLNEEVKNTGARLMVFLLPTREQIDFASWSEVITAYHIMPNELDMLKPNRLLRQFAKELDIQFIDLLEPMRAAKHDIYFVGDEHLTPAGHQIIASELGAGLKAEDKSHPLLLSKGSVGDRYPNYSKDGNLITYQSQVDGSPELFIWNRDLTYEKRITTNNLTESHPILSNDGSKLAFTEGDPETFRTKVVIEDLNNDNTRRIITEDTNIFSAIPWFSPDDKYLAYAEWRQLAKGVFSNSQIVIVELETGEKRYITNADCESWRPVFSPDGKRLIYISRRKGQFDLYFYYLETGREERLTWTLYDEWDPQFSRDGKRIVYSAKPDGNWDLFVYELLTGDTYRITESRGDEWDPSFDYAGDNIIFAGRFGSIEGIYKIAFSRDKPFK